MSRTCLKTLRLTPEEDRLVAAYLRGNPLFDGFGSLARVATLEFIRSRRSLSLCPSPEPEEGVRRPVFLWDYDLTEAQVREVLARGGKDRDWLMGRILDQAPLQEILKYLSLDEIREALPRLRLRLKKKAHWEYALKRWGTA